MPEIINSNEPWIAEVPVGDWFYSPGFTYDSGRMIHYLIEAIPRDGNAAVCISILPDGSLDEGSQRMLKEVGIWMRRNGQAVYGSHAWTIPGEGEEINGKLKMLQGGALTQKQANFKFDTRDFRFTQGKNGSLYAFSVIQPAAGTLLKIKSLGTNSPYLKQKVKTVTLLGYGGKLQWEQETNSLSVTYPQDLAFATSVVFKID